MTWPRLLNMLRLGRVSAVDDTRAVQRVQVTEAGPGPDGSPAVVDDVAVLGLYGLASVAPLKSDVLVVRLFGGRSLSVAVGFNHQPTRLRGLSPGDTALYDVRGAYVRFTEAGLEIDGAGLPMTIRNVGGAVTIDAAQLRVTGDVLSRCDGEAVSLNDLADQYDAHGHTGVQPGAGTSGPTDHPLS